MSGNEPEWLEEFEARRKAHIKMGGQAAIAKQHSYGKLTVRERCDILLDEDSFLEMGRMAGKGIYDENGLFVDLEPTNAIMGTGRINGRKVCLTADDYTIKAGSSEASNPDKWIYAERKALAYRMPLVRLVESAGGSVKLLAKMGATKIPEYPNLPLRQLLDTVPVVGVAMGPCAGLGAVKVLASHFSVIVNDTATVMAAGPPVVKQAYGVDVTKEELGGYKVHRKSGLVHNEASSEEDALQQVATFLSYLPRNIYRMPPVVKPSDNQGRVEDWLKNAIPTDRRKIFKSRKILEAIFDLNSIFEMGKNHGRSLVTSFARINGFPVGVMINDPKVSGGAMSTVSAMKNERFVKLCDQFHLPVVSFVDQPGNETGVEAEIAATLLGALRVHEAQEHSSSPWMSVMIRRCFGMAGAYHAPKEGGALNHRVAWPTARWGSIPIEGGVMAAHKQEILQADDPVAKQKELELYYLNLSSPFKTAERFGIVDVIDPRETREVLCDWVEDAWEVLETDLNKK
jgi:acetyl-CoA carboxylase carboxyltransferase component